MALCRTYIIVLSCFSSLMLGCDQSGGSKAKTGKDQSASSLLLSNLAFTFESVCDEPVEIRTDRNGVERLQPRLGNRCRLVDVEQGVREEFDRAETSCKMISDAETCSVYSDLADVYDKLISEPEVKSVCCLNPSAVLEACGQLYGNIAGCARNADSAELLQAYKDIEPLLCRCGGKAGRSLGEDCFDLNRPIEVYEMSLDANLYSFPIQDFQTKSKNSELRIPFRDRIDNLSDISTGALFDDMDGEITARFLTQFDESGNGSWAMYFQVDQTIEGDIVSVQAFTCQLNSQPRYFASGQNIRNNSKIVDPLFSCAGMSVNQSVLQDIANENVLEESYFSLLFGEESFQAFMCVGGKDLDDPSQQMEAFNVSHLTGRYRSNLQSVVVNSDKSLLSFGWGTVADWRNSPYFVSNRDGDWLTSLEQWFSGGQGGEDHLGTLHTKIGRLPARP